MIAFGEIERTGEKDDVAYFRVLFQNSERGTEKNTKNFGVVHAPAENRTGNLTA
jgi:hypothetical protein